ncbi:DUF3817 domain-containing protein [Halothiobacillus sp. DCM-1]|uniref:DUF3817 domain-containing protein n=1 Tax=Halothiobacillus sp. DCM-1 TaxID=3112558 RepID=UPI003250FF42
MIERRHLLRHLSFLTLLEGGSLIALVLIAVPLKYLWAAPLAVKIIGPIHGAFFIWTVLTLALAAARRALPLGKAGLVFLAALVPFGGLWSHRLIDRERAKLPSND